MVASFLMVGGPEAQNRSVAVFAAECGAETRAVSFLAIVWNWNLETREDSVAPIHQNLQMVKIDDRFRWDQNLCRLLDALGIDEIKCLSSVLMQLRCLLMKYIG
jgi:hypothetical protein